MAEPDRRSVIKACIEVAERIGEAEIAHGIREPVFADRVAKSRARESGIAETVFAQSGVTEPVGGVAHPVAEAASIQAAIAEPARIAEATGIAEAARITEAACVAEAPGIAEAACIAKTACVAAEASAIADATAHAADTTGIAHRHISGSGCGVSLDPTETRFLFLRLTLP
jgi:hypothetical protein